MKEKGTLFLIPVPLADEATAASFTLFTAQLLNEIKHYLVENSKTARKFLKLGGLQTPQQELIIYDYGKHERKEQNYNTFFNVLLEGTDAGLMSEAGCPGIADPGSEIIAKAHELGIKVRPLVGPNSIILALMASGFNGQCFTFHGYLPIDKNQRSQKIKSLEKDIHRNDATQIFIETPFRNHALFDDIIRNCKPSLKLCIACNISAEDESIATKTIAEWAKLKPDLHKKPCVFALYR